jgi:glutathione-specific gamma-glutamylcyclotransferase
MHGSGDFWVFGYGSLMWDPGFPFEDVRPAQLGDYHRAFCIYSHHYRGTPDRPGLVLGLRSGGHCIGRAFLVAEKNGTEVLAYLEEREMTSYVYRPARLPIVVEGQTVEAQTYVADEQHPQYACGLTPEATARLILSGRGRRGPNVEYLENTVAHLEEMGVAEPELVELRDLVRKLAAA